MGKGDKICEVCNKKQKKCDKDKGPHLGKQSHCVLCESDTDIHSNNRCPYQQSRFGYYFYSVMEAEVKRLRNVSRNIVLLYTDIKSNLDLRINCHIINSELILDDPPRNRIEEALDGSEFRYIDEYLEYDDF